MDLLNIVCGRSGGGGGVHKKLKYMTIRISQNEKDALNTKVSLFLHLIALAPWAEVYLETAK